MSKFGKIDWERLRTYSTANWMALEEEIEAAIAAELQERKQARQEEIARRQKKAKRKRRRSERILQ